MTKNVVVPTTAKRKRDKKALAASGEAKPFDVTQGRQVRNDKERSRADYR